jgi:hypothetical protein
VKVFPGRERKIKIRTEIMGLEDFDTLPSNDDLNEAFDDDLRGQIDIPSMGSDY